MIVTDIDALVRDRLKGLDEARSSGTKIVGYFPGGYVPGELIYASGAIPLCLAHGGDARKADEGLAVLPSVICPFARAQVGEMLLETNPRSTACSISW
jgi:benzoyl-CoA reductase/2-hydroxyglutaryl-CoA dehydratase subunit BcrC/BadD/HgdB